MKRKLLSFIALTACTVYLFAYENRNLLQQCATEEDVRQSLVMEQKWVPYPDYADRDGWDKLFGTHKEQIIRQGEQYLGFGWIVVKATDYMEYERSGNRNIMQDPQGKNNRALGALVAAELAEGKGRFVDDIINGVLYSCEMTSWALSAHLQSAQKSKRPFPDHREDIMDLTSGDMAQMLSWTYHFLRREFDKVDPAIAIRLRHELQKRELDPYMQRSDFWWMAFDHKPGKIINNWNPWCNFNALTCFMLLEDDRDKLAKAVYRTMLSTDFFINYVKADGACEEGPSYWGHAAGKLYDYLYMLSLGTGGRVSLFNHPQIRHMGEYIARSYVGKRWVVNFADASARGGGSTSLIYQYGKAVNSPLMTSFAVHRHKEDPVTPPSRWLDMFEALETMRTLPMLDNEQATYSAPAFTWYPETEFCYINHQGMFLAAKGGHNNESHNHNDIGTFSLYFDQTPIIIDAGVGTYTRQTFSSERYTIWTMQSNYHNLPMINGVPQRFGGEYKASDVVVSRKRKSFSLNIATAYPPEAQVKDWTRSYRLKGDRLEITDRFALNEAQTPNRIHFLTWGKPDTSEAGSVMIRTAEGTFAVLRYDARQFTATVETIELTDSRLSDVWGAEIYRLSLVAKNLEKTGQYTYSILKHRGQKR